MLRNALNSIGLIYNHSIKSGKIDFEYEHVKHCNEVSLSYK